MEKSGIAKGDEKKIYLYIEMSSLSNENRLIYP